ncbi:hypothetical protein BC628DRAFT_220665 [Trametes gibbosa]|nr:hypothetical protein BC628DRAFT_220665 [Trametes gibbosa]
MRKWAEATGALALMRALLRPLAHSSARCLVLRHSFLASRNITLTDIISAHHPSLERAIFQAVTFGEDCHYSHRWIR